MIYVIGDSHSQHCFCGNSTFKVIHTPERTAYKLPTHHPQVAAAFNAVPKGSKVICVYGEIDCRIHIFLKHKKLDKSIDSLITATADTYLDYINTYAKDYDIHIFNVVPMGVQTNTAKYPFFGTKEERKSIVEGLNVKLKEGCEKRGLTFIDVYSMLVDSEGYRLPIYVGDAAHLNNKVAPLVLNKYFKE